jgi:uncharacterized protein (DUF1499 family)
MPRTIMLSGLAVALALALLLAFAIWRGDRSLGMASLWQNLAGPADLGPVDFAAVRRSATGNDALACPPGFCATAPSDMDVPVFAVPAATVRDTLRQIAAADQDVTLVASDDGVLHDRYVARTRLMRFPDTVNVRVIDLGEGRSTLAIHSRSQLGRRDFGVNRARIGAWLAALSARLSRA